MPDTRALLRLATIFYAAVALFALAWAWWFEHPLLGGEAPTGAGLGVGLLVGLVIVALCHVAYRFSKSVRGASRFMAEFVGPVGVLPAVWLAVLSGFVEEITFRGALWPQLGLVGTSILFGLCHIVPVRVLAGYPLFAFFAGLGFGLLRERTGSVWPPVVAHFTVNALNLAWLGAQERRRPVRETTVPVVEKSAPPAPEPLDLPEVEESFPLTIWRYDLRVELVGTDCETLPQCLEHEPLALFDHVAREQVYRELRDGLFVFAESFSTPFAGFASDIAAISAYIFEPVIGLEVAERYTDESTTDDVRAWKIVARRGEWVKVPLLIDAPENGRFVVDAEREDTEVMTAQWESYPRWFQDGMRFKYPRLREL